LGVGSYKVWLRGKTPKGAYWRRRGLLVGEEEEAVRGMV